jgi:hypothetical protein
MCCFYHTSNTINLVTTTKYISFWVIEYRVFVKDFVDCSATTHEVIFSLRLRSNKVEMLLDIVFSVSDRVAAPKHSKPQVISHEGV